jgi:hypothetical protein
MVITVKNFQPHTCTCAHHSIDLSCANSCCSQAKPSCDENVFLETYDSLISRENDDKGVIKLNERQRSCVTISR